MKKFISVLLAISILFTFYSFILPVNASTNTSIEEFAEGMSELYAEEVADGKKLEESAECRVIVKATSKPNTYGYAESIVENNNLYIYQYSDAETAEEAVKYYNELPYVKWAELDGIVETQALSYGNYMVQGDEAKEFVFNNNIPMNEVVVAVLDTGANCYAEIWEGRVIDSGYNLSDTGTPNSVETENRHGSHVTSVIFDNTPENVKLVEYKTLNCYGLGTNLSVALGIELAVDDGVDVINISSASNTFSNVLYEAVQYAHSKNVVVVCAAGNEGADVRNSYPAAFDEVFTVGSIDQKGNHSFFSNFGEEIDFVAPGHNIEFFDSTDDYGTSFSAPFVSAAAAMTLSVNPDLTINETKNILIESCVPYEELSYHDGFHVIEDYDYSDDNAPKEALIEDMASDESLYYGYGMPQIQNAIGIVLGYEKAIKPEISVESGTYHDEFEVTISAPEGYEIYYTTDEVYPTKDSATLYSSPVEITGSQSIRAIAYSPNGTKSVHSTAEYRMLFYADEKDFTIDSDGYLLSYTGELKEFIVPETINGITVTGIGEYAIHNDNIVSVVFPETLTDIAFYGLYVRNAIYISAKGLVNVGDSGILGINVAEFDAPNIESVGSMILGVREINFPKLTEIGKNAFSTFKQLKYAELPLITQLPAYAFKNCNVLWEVNCPMVTSIDFGAFANCYWLKELNIPNVKEFISTIRMTPAVKREDLGTFSKCINLIEINFPNVVTIENCRLFNKCYNLTSILLPKAETICDEAFIYCENLINVFIPEVKIVGNNAFAETYSLKNVRLPNVKEIGNYAFKNSSIESLIAPELESIGKYCFTYYDIMRETHHQNTTFNYLNAPSLKTTADYAFAYTGALTKLELPSLTDLGKNAFLESSVSYLDAPMLKKASSLPTAENSIAIFSSEFSECSLDATGYDLTIYGTYGTYAETYANQYKLIFVGVPVIASQPASIYSSIAETLETNAIGVNLTYQWYGTDSPENLNGTAVEGATNKVFDPTAFESYPYYYCIVTSTDGDYVAEIITDIVENSLHFYAADYTALESAIAKIPANLSVYTDESVTALNDVLNGIDRNLNAIHQKRVDEYVIALTEAIEALKLKSADYTALESAIAKIPANLSIYTDDSVKTLNDVLNSIDNSLDITQQERVDEYVIALTEAIEALKLKSADYTALEAAIAKIPVNLSIYTDESVKALNDVLNSIDNSLDITQQKQVDEYVIKVNNAVSALVLKSADYAELEIAIKAVPSDLSIYTDESSAELKAILAEIDKNLDITKQEQIDKWAEEIPIAVQKLVLKPADYSILDTTISKIPDNLSIYTDESVMELEKVLNGIDRELDITHQEQVNNYVTEVEQAISKLNYKPADYSALEKVLATVPSDLSVYTEESVAALQETIDNIDYSLDITQQDQVDDYAEQITEAIGNLKVECWLIRLFKAIIVFIRKIFIRVTTLFA